MGENALVTNRVAAGRQILEALDEASVPVDVAIWWLDEGKWTFSIHTPLIEVIGKAQAYKRVQAALKGKNTALQIDGINLVPRSHQLVRAMLGTIRVDGISDVSISESMLNGVFIDEAILMRATIPTPSGSPSASADGSPPAWFKPSWLEKS